MRKILAASALILISLSACKTASSAADGVKSAGSAVAEGAESAGEAVASGVGGAATSFVNVNLSNVLNDLALDLKIDRANIPVNAQIPITIAANVCGVSINILSIGAGGGSSKGCTAVTTSPQLAQAVQQQLSTGGGTQTSAAPAPASPTTTGTTEPAPTTATPPQDTTTPQETTPNPPQN